MKIMYPILFAIVLSSCSTPSTPPPTSTVSPSKTPSITQAPPATVTAVCIPPVPGEEDVEIALDHGGDVFDPAEWEGSHVVNEDSVSVTWQNIPLSALAFIQVIIFPCGYEEPDLNHFFNDEHWEALFANYDSYEMIDECRSEQGLRLYELEAVSQEVDYNIRYWSENDTNERIITTMLTFPFGSEDVMDEYSIALFPELPNCS
jgi:hypothetical protein